ncbi:SusC/RagA family TonB-linked outer membrane protein [Maribellus comscasis]|uniref:SusC/RagA family TonB-linked outer membrane protein n=1 Tax=Maribellus comscasis TaxID=2681766 RepID=A0A6I6K022_9BACT|nr:TonB-dependent receptor [Maribellus comscasis]QGY46778.1 SusC/RagA family TonB-linked outer membrane protein [Maribellus comscasis]
MNKLKLLFLVLFILPLALFAQNKITGVVKSDAGELLPGVTIIVEGTTQGTTTNFNGEYSITAPADGNLMFSFIGYLSQTVPVNGQSAINVVLQQDIEELEQVVVIGYGTVKKSDLTGSVTSVKADELNPGANASVEQALQGRVAGVQISQKSNEPGGGLSISIRGSGSIQAGNEPLYVIDGVIVNNGSVAGTGGVGFTGNQNPRNPLNSLNPSDIASLEVLKDASATAIYGSRGSNGVVIITTKKGKEGKLRVGYDGYYGIQQVYKPLDVLTAQEYKDVLNSIIDLGGGDELQRIDQIEGGGTDWQDLIYRTARTQNHNITMSGGSNNLTYFTSLNYFEQEGLVKGSAIDRYNMRFNLAYDESKKLRAGVSFNGSYIHDDFASTGLGINENGGAIYTAVNYDPVIPSYNEDGSYRKSDFFVGDNPLAILDGEDATAETFRFFGNTYLEYFIMPELSAQVKLGGDVQDVRRDIFIQPFTVSGAGTGGIASIQTGRKDYVSAEGTINYTKEFEQSRLNALLGTTYEYFQTKTFAGDGRGYALPDLGINAIGSGDPLLNNLGSGRTQAKFISYLTRVNYSLMDKYLITASIRADGSSRFGENNKFGYFPSAAIAWKMHNENFMADAGWLSELKPRFSIGSTGNATIGNELTYQTFSAGSQVPFGDAYYSTITPSRIANPDLTWEKAVQIDVGFDFGILENRLTGSFDYFNKETTDLLVYIPQPLNTGFSGQVQNMGGVRNQGFELSLSWDIIRSNDLYWNLAGNLSTLKNEVLNIGDRGDIIRGGLSQIPDFSIITPGEALDSYYGYIVDGIWQEGDDFSVTNDNVQPGDLKFRDLNDDKTINSEDRTIIGKPIPDFTWGLTSNLQFKNFSLDIVMQGVQGIDKLNANLANSMFPNNFRQNRIAEPLLNRWTPSNPSNKYPSFVNPLASGGTTALINTITVEDASYIRLQSVRLGYDVPVENISVFNKLAIYVLAQNLFTVTNYQGTDPGANASGSNTAAIDFNAYPLPRTYMVGLNVEF